MNIRHHLVLSLSLFQFLITMNKKQDIPDDILDAESKYIGGLLKRVSNFDMSSLKGRTIFQKTIYLMQAFDIPLGYKFRWWMFGVYSSQLAQVGFYMVDKMDEITPAEFTEQQYEEKFKRFLTFIEPYKNDEKMLEILSSLHWFWNKTPGENKEFYIDMVYNAKGIKIEKLNHGWDILHASGIV